MHRKKFYRIAASVLAAAMVMHGSIFGMAEEAPQAEEPQTEAATQAPEPETQAPEPETQAPEPETQAPTEAPETQAPETEPQTQAPTEAPETQAPETEPQTQAPTETPETQAPETEPQTQVPTEKETEKETETETETEKQKRSARVNDGMIYDAAKLEKDLEKALPYLFAAQDVNVEGDKEIPADIPILQGESATEVLKSLEDVSLSLANAQSSTDVEILNIYADAEGHLDTAQLDMISEDHVIDVTNKYFVINIIADSPEQDLEFRDYEMMMKDQEVWYEEESQPGDILYNFAALEADQFVAFEGTVELTDPEVIQGTFLAPDAEVEVKNDLSGAVYADQITVDESVQNLLPIVFIKGAQLPETEDATEAPTEEDTEGATEAPTEEATEEATEAPTEISTEPVTEEDTEIQEETEEIIDVPTETETEEVIDIPTEEETESDTENVTEAVTEKQTEEHINPLILDEDPEDEPVPYGEGDVHLQMLLKDIENEDTPVSGGTISIHAAEQIVKDGTVIAEKDQEVVSAPTGADGKTEDIGSVLVPGATYYMLVTAPGYPGIPQIHFKVGADSVPVFDPATGTSFADGVLSISLYKTANVILTVKKADHPDQQINNATFVLKDSKGNVLVDSAGNPLFLITYAGAEFALRGLSEGATYLLSQLTTESGYQVAPDQTFTVKAGEVLPVEVKNEPNPADGKKVLVSAQVLYNGVVLTANAQKVYYAALFQNDKRVSEVQTITFAKDKAVVENVVFHAVKGTYQLKATDAYGVPVMEPYAASSEVIIGEKTEDEIAILPVIYKLGQYPEKQFYYKAKVRLIKRVQNSAGKAKKVTKDFTAKLFSDSARKKPLSATFNFSLVEKSAAYSQSYSIKMTKDTVDLYLGETFANGSLILEGDESFDYVPIYDTVFTISCEEGDQPGVQKTTEATIINQEKATSVKIAATDTSGNYLTGVILVLKNSDGKIITLNNRSAYISENGDIEISGLTPGKQYYLSEVAAPSGYAPAEDLPFTVQSKHDNYINLIHQKPTSTGNDITVTKQVYAGEYPIYTRDTATGQYESEGRYTFNVALFDDADHKVKVSDVKEITVKDSSGTVTFENVEKNRTYYLAETNEFGQVRSDSNTRVIKYGNNGVITVKKGSNSAVVQNIYSSLPTGYRYRAVMNIKKKVTDKEGNAVDVSGTFNIGIYKNSDYSDTPQVLKLSLNNTDSASKEAAVYLTSSQLTYYFAELDDSGKRVTDKSEDFSYKVSIDSPTLKLGPNDNKTVTITNQEKKEDQSKVTLYLTKRVYKGTSKHAVSETFYIGLFKDEKFTKLYTKPIPFELKNKSDLTKKLTLKLGSSEKTIYVAETDSTGKVIKDYKTFGYEVKLVNSKAEFTKERTEVQSIVLNSVYGTVSDDDWRHILDDDENNLGDDDSVSGNGEASASTAGNVKTGDDTPILLYIALMAGAFIIFVGLVIFFIITRKKRR